MIVFPPSLALWLFSSVPHPKKGDPMKLPEPRLKGDISLETALKHRRTVRAYRPDPLSIDQCGQLLWAGQGISEDRGYKRTAPSAGALYPMDVYAVVGPGTVGGLREGVYHYEPQSHTVSLVSPGDKRDALARASLSQSWMAAAPVNLVITAEYERVTPKYGERGVRYAMMEAGHIAQNVFLQAESFGLRAGIVGAFQDGDVTRALDLPGSHQPLLILPVGYGR
jgi:SagB-type dehydrogenase family enzyme